MDLVRNGVEDPRFLAMKKGFVFAFADTEGNKQVAMVVVPSQFEIGDLGDPNPNTYPQWRDDRPNIDINAMSKIMEIAFKREWRATDRLVILGISDNTDGGLNLQYTGTTGFFFNVSIDKQILPDTSVHLRVTTPNESPFAVPSQSRYLEAIKDNSNFIYYDNTSASVIKALYRSLIVDSRQMVEDFGRIKTDYDSSMTSAVNYILGGGVNFPFRVWNTGRNVY